MEARCEAVRKREWRARRRRELRQVCAACDAIFNPRRADAKFCGAACRQKGHRRRKAGGEMATTRLTGAPWRVSAPVRRRSPGSSPRRLSGPSCAARTAGSSTWRASSAEAQNSIGPPEKFRKTFADLSSVSPDMKGAPEVYGARRNEPPFRNPKETKDDATAQHGWNCVFRDEPADRLAVTSASAQEVSAGIYRRLLFYVGYADRR
jgi:hypothetical protein